MRRVAAIYPKLGRSGRAEAAVTALCHGLMDSGA